MLFALTIAGSPAPLVLSQAYLLYEGICVSLHVPFRSNSSLVQFFLFLFMAVIIALDTVSQQ